jgi:hypothetical protein
MDIVVYQVICILSRVDLNYTVEFDYYPYNFTVDSLLIMVSGTALKIISAIALRQLLKGSSLVFTKRSA